jgi:hypothetical protein
MNWKECGSGTYHIIIPTFSWRNRGKVGKTETMIAGGPDKI